MEQTFSGKNKFIKTNFEIFLLYFESIEPQITLAADNWSR